MIQVSNPDLTDLEVQAATSVVRSGHITQGEKVHEFQAAFAEYLGVPHALACSSGTTALHLALLALGVGPGDEVIVPDVSFVATVNAVRYVGATPVLCDITGRNWGLNPEKVEKLITPRTAAIIAVHLYGVSCDIYELSRIAGEHHLALVEDAAEGLGGFAYHGEPLGTLSDIATFSFYGNKVITTGEGGMVVTRHSELRDAVYSYRGQCVHPDVRFFHTDVGYNYRMTDIQAAIGLAQLSRIDEILMKRRAVFNAYDCHLGDLLSPISGCSFHSPQFNNPRVAPWLYTLTTGYGLTSQFGHSALSRRLLDAGYETRPFFVPMHELPMYWSSPGDFPVSNYCREYGISLPTHAELTGDQIAEIAAEVRKEVY